MLAQLDFDVVLLFFKLPRELLGEVKLKAQQVSVC